MEDRCCEILVGQLLPAAQGTFVKPKGSVDLDEDIVSRIRGLLEDSKTRAVVHLAPTRRSSNQSLPTQKPAEALARPLASIPAASTLSTVNTLDLIRVTLSLSSDRSSHSSPGLNKDGKASSDGAMSTRSSMKSESNPRIDQCRPGRTGRKADASRNGKRGAALMQHQRQSRLPWLDGNKSKPTVSRLPGLFVEDDKQLSKDSPRSPLSQSGDASSPSMSTLPQTQQPISNDQATVNSNDALPVLSSSVAPQHETRPLHQPKPRNQASRLAPRFSTGQGRPADDIYSHESQPAYPLAALARDLRPSRSSPSLPREIPPKSAPSAAVEQSTGSPSPLSGGPHPARYAATGPQVVKSRAQNLRESISSLEQLIGEASQLAQNAARDHQSDELPKILGEAAQAIHEAAQVRDNQRQAMEVPLAEAGGAVPYDLSPSGSSDEESTYSQASSISSSPPQSLKGPVGHVVKETPATVLPESARASARPVPTTVDWGYTNSRAVAENDVPSTLYGPVRKRQPRPGARFESSPLREEVIPHSEQSERKEVPQLLPRKSSLANQRRNQPEGLLSGADISRNQRGYGTPPTGRQGPNAGQNWGRDKFDERDYIGGDDLKGKRHITLGDNQRWSLHHHRRQPIARNWSTSRKRFTAAVACLNTALIGVLIGIYVSREPIVYVCSPTSSPDPG